MAEFYKFVGSGIVKCENENSCRNCKYRATVPNKKNEIWCDFVDVIPVGFIVSHKNCNHFKWCIEESKVSSMLKICDDVDLKELMKYGFEADNRGYFKTLDSENLDIDELVIGEDRIIRNLECLDTPEDAYYGESVLPKAFYYKVEDLIKAKLVEEVEGEE